MATLLHISDLHLGTGDADEEFGDHKVEVVRPTDRQTRLSTLKVTLRALAAGLRATGEDLDAVVVSGDVTYQGGPAGFGMLEGLLAELGDKLPPPSRIVVVPGNHDVGWYTEPGSAERYEAFLREVRGRGYVTPNLEGVDLEPGSSAAGSNSPVLVAADETYAIVALNSSNNCGVVVPLGDLADDANDIERRKKDGPAKRILDAYRRASRFDVARIGDAQREAASSALAEAVATLGRATVRVAVMHHQLLPISLDEEVKPFESLVNLAQVRDWLAINQVGLVLHGHKHVAHAYEDWYLPLGTGSGASGPRRIVVSAVGTVGLGQAPTNCLARLVRFDPDRAETGRIAVVDVPGVQPGIPLDIESLPRKSFSTLATSGDSMVIRGLTPQQVHEQLLDLVENRDDLVGPIVCQVASPDGAEQMPDSYKRLPDVPADPHWFGELVALWQRSPRLSTMNFNHGERIFAMHGINQLDAAIQALGAKDTSSRAIITLFDHSTDRPNGSAEFPAFCVVQFVLVTNELRVVAYFRKQEMRYWWPINLAELAQLQQTAVTQLNRTRGNSPVAPGSITTVTAMPTAGSTVPRVAIPKVDRWVDDAPERLLRMAVVVLNPNIASAADALKDWETLTDECKPKAGRAADGDPLPVAGLGRLHGELGKLAVIYGATALSREAASVLQRAHLLSQQIADRSRQDAVEASQSGDMEALHGELAELSDQIRRSVASASDPESPRSMRT